MRVIEPGHTYALQNNKGGDGETVLTFFMDPAIHGGKHQAGTTNQEVARALIDRLIYLEKEAPWGGDSHLIHNLQELIVMHEVRAAARHGICSLAAMTDLVNRGRVVGGIERVAARREDGHIYDKAIHTAASCGGRCNIKEVAGTSPPALKDTRTHEEFP